jgi:hypothetical protein
VRHQSPLLKASDVAILSSAHRRQQHDSGSLPATPHRADDPRPRRYLHVGARRVVHERPKLLSVRSWSSCCRARGRPASEHADQDGGWELAQPSRPSGSRNSGQSDGCEVEAKVLDLMAPALGAGRAKELIAALDCIDRVSRLRRLFAGIAGFVVKRRRWRNRQRHHISAGPKRSYHSSRTFLVMMIRLRTADLGSLRA